MNTTLIYAGIALGALLVLGLILTRLYRRAPKDAALIRTGFGGEKVVLNGGVIVLPVLHELMPVSLQTIKLEVARRGADSLLTADKIRVDVEGLFHVRVAPNVNSISAAAQTLGARINEKAAVSELVSGKLISALRSVAATMTMQDLHANRATFQQEVQKTLQDLSTNGLELESVSITHLDQTDIKNLNPDNAFDAEGLTVIKRITEDRKKLRNEIEAENRVAIEQRNLEANKQSLEIKRADEFAQMEQARAIATSRAENDARIAAETAAREQEAEQARIEAERATKQREIEAQRAIEEAEIARAQAVELARQQQSIAVAEKSRDESVAKAEADRARAEAVKAEEGVKTAQQTAVAEREREIEVIEARKSAERDAVQITVAAEAEKKAAVDKADATLTAARADAEAEKLRAEAAEVTFRVSAEGERTMNEARNILSTDQIGYATKLEAIKVMPSIIEQSVKPISAIDSIKIIDVGGLNGSGSGIVSADGTVGTTVNNGNLADQAVNAALKYRVNAPVLEDLARSVFGDGADLSSLSGLTGLVSETKTAKVEDTAKAAEKAKVETPETLETMAEPTATEIGQFYTGGEGKRRNRRDKDAGDQAAAQG